LIINRKDKLFYEKIDTKNPKLAS